MRSFVYRAGIAAAILALSACSVNSGVPAQREGQVPGARLPRVTGTYSAIYSFGTKGPYDPGGSRSTLLALNGTLYGTSSSGGTMGLGAAYSVTPGGSVKVLHSFGSDADDGRDPWYGASLVAVGNSLYGTTTDGGHFGNGTVYELKTSGSEKVLYSFGASKTDGFHPEGSLCYFGGKLYGTFYDVAKIFAASPKGGAKSVYTFSGPYAPNGSRAGLVAIGKTLYGTSEQGGVHRAGTVFSVTPPSSGTTIVNFIAGFNGELPEWGLTVGKSILYGVAGGVANGEDGIAFGITPSGHRVMLHQFTGGDGIGPAQLTYVNGVLFGTAVTGGKYGYGTLFSMDVKGRVRVLHDFQGGTDGANPSSGPAYMNGTLYGTTSYGGDQNLGVVYAYKL